MGYIQKILQQKRRIKSWLPKKENKIQDRVDAVKDKSEEYIIKQEFKGVNTVDDLFKQLETK